MEELQRKRAIADLLDPKEIADLTLGLVEIPSPTGNESEVAEYYASVLRDYGLEVELAPLQDGRPNVIGKLRGTGTGRSMMLHGHLDTVPAGHCISPKIVEGRVFGRGASDMKGSMAAMACTAKALVESRETLGGDVYVIGTINHEDPEGNGSGIKLIASRIAEGDLKIQAAINTEGPFDGLKIVQGGLAVFTIRLIRLGGKTYSADSTLDGNPILWVAKVIEQLSLMDMELAAKGVDHLIMKRPTIQVGVIEAGEHTFTVPTEARLLGAVRWDPGEDYATVSSAFIEAMKRLEVTLRERHDPTATIGVDIRLGREACKVPDDSGIVSVMKKAILEVRGEPARLIGSRYCTDLSIIVGEGKIPAVEYGPFLPSDMTLHTDNESVDIDRLLTMSKVYCHAIVDFCS